MSRTAMLRHTSRRYLTIDVVWAVVVVGGLFLVLQQQQIQPNDFWWQLRLGELVVEGRAIPSIEPFAFTLAGERWVDQPWLALNGSSATEAAA
jgi:hypothetical protein